MWLQLCIVTGGNMGLIPAQGSKIQHAIECRQKLKKNNYQNLPTQTQTIMTSF